MKRTTGKPVAKRKQVGAQISEPIYLKARAQALTEGRTIGELIDSALEEYLEKNLLEKEG